MRGGRRERERDKTRREREREELGDRKKGGNEGLLLQVTTPAIPYNVVIKSNEAYS